MSTRAKRRARSPETPLVAQKLIGVTSSGPSSGLRKLLWSLIALNFLSWGLIALMCHSGA